MSNKPIILITGASGFLGNRLFIRLRKLAYTVFGTSNQTNDPQLIKMDLKKFTDVKKVINQVKPSVIFHLAAFINLSRNYKAATNCISTNIQGTVNLLEALRNNPPTKFVLASTEEIYGDNYLPYKENQTPHPPSPYSISKIACENLCSLYAQELNFPLAILRIATFYGPKNPNQSLISQIIVKALKNKQITLNSGVKQRDYIYIDDILKACYLILTKTLPKQINIFNLGGGISYSLKEIVNKIIAITKSQSKVTYDPKLDRVLETDRWLLDISKAKNVLGWQPKISLDLGLKKTVNCFKSKKDYNE